MTTAAAEELTKQITFRKTIAPAGHFLTRPVRLLRGYDLANFRPDLVAGITVAVILLPQAIAFALIAELPPQMGLYTAIVGGLVGALWGSSDQLHNGPTNPIALLVLSSLASVAVIGSPEYIMAASLLALLVGLFQLLLGLARLGVLVNFVSHSVLIGFATGAGVLIAIRQIPPLLGLEYDSDSMVGVVTGAFTHIGEVNLPTAAIGIGTIVFLIVTRRISPRIPGALLAMVLSSLVVFAFNLATEGVAVIGTLPEGLPPLSLPQFDWYLISSMTAGVIAVGAIGLVQSIAVSKSVAAETRQRLDSNQEFVGQGMANIFAGLFSGFPVSGSFSRTAVNLRAGAKTPIAAILSSLFVLLAMQFLGPFTAYLPRSALAGVLIITSYRMIDGQEIMRILRGGRGDAVIMVVTLLGTLLLQLETAVLIGIALSLARYILHTSTPRVHAVVPGEDFRHFNYDPDRPECPQLEIIEILGDLYFGAVNYVEEFILDRSAQRPQQIYLLLRMHNVNNIDFSGIHMLESVVKQYRERGGDVFMVRVSHRVMQRMIDTGFDSYLGQDHFLGDDNAISDIFYHVLDPAVCIYECPVRVFRECQNLPKRLDLIEPRFDLSDAPQEIHWIDAATLWAELHNGAEQRPIVIDVREPREFRQGHIAEAQSIPLTKLAETAAVAKEDQDIVVVCRTSRRSKLAASALQSMGYENVRVLSGGMTSWEAAKLLEAVEAFPTNGESP